ncbi:flavin containing amine oxidoreductase [Legionella birminghamensis]|uniref:Flavin containing amine oxidoreductase n=1 Tax=Legionella birminghamensis TaxID=28083 RepID=A0A378I5T9_9GAMM|nr:cyclic nucleotide-binding domain-containing protein [Legionella birminghamensis]KTC70219.1 flavin containing amine oxidoreductase [Legionella birminghamensis]STX30373.1 flavin containing amine oxidoreductase [Legionella birminghamensis]
MDIVIVGGGASSIAAAFTLANQNYNVTIIEELGHLGGHCFGVKVADSQGPSWMLDAGVTDFNQDQFHYFKQFIDFFKLPYHPINQSLSIIDEKNNLVFANIDGLISIRKDCPIGKDLYIEEINRFRVESWEFLNSHSNSEITLGNYLKNKAYSKPFIEEYIYPRATACFQVPNTYPENYRLIPLLQFWQIHGIIGPIGRRMALDDGMFSYVEVFSKWFIAKHRNNRILLNKRVLGIARHDNKVFIRASSPSGENVSLTFDHVIISINPYHAISLFEDAKKYEKNLLVNFPWQRATFAIHSDSAIMPKDRAYWGGYNCIYTPESSTLLRPTITFYINKIRNLPANIPDVFLTLNPFRQIDPKKIFEQKFYIHPSMAHSSDISRQYLEAIQGENNTWYCGSYLVPPHVHESAFISGIKVAEKISRSLQKPAGKTKYNPLYFSDFVEKIPVFSGVDPIIFHDIGLISTVETFKANSCIFQEQTPANGMYIIIKGEISIVATKSSIKEVATLGAGELFGELGILANIPRTANAIAKTDSEVFFIQKNTLDSIFNHSNYSAFIFTQRIINYVAQHIEQTCHKLRFAPIAEKTTLCAPWQAFEQLGNEQKRTIKSLELFASFSDTLKNAYLKKFHFFSFEKNAEIPLSITHQFLLILVEGEARLSVKWKKQIRSVSKISATKLINPWVTSPVHLSCFKIIATEKTLIIALPPEHINYHQLQELVIPVFKKIKTQLAELQNAINEL